MRPILYVIFAAFCQTAALQNSPAPDSARQTSVLAVLPHDSDSVRPADSVATLDKMVVTATRTRRRMSQTPASVTVISRQEIASSPARDINDLVEDKASVQTNRVVTIGEGVPSSIIMRGIPGSLAASRTLVLVDGIPSNAAGTPFLIVSESPLDAIESVEIVRGP
jgi:outer membrane cobalamin receptor